MQGKLVGTNQTAENMLQVFELMAKRGEPIRLLDIAEETGIPSATLLRIINTLLVNGYVDQDKDTYKYSLTLKLSYLGGLVSSSVNITSIVRPHLERLGRELGVPACLTMENRLQCILVDVADPLTSVISILHRIGDLTPMHCKSAGKVLMEGFSGAKLDEYIRKVGLKAYTNKTITDKEALLKELATVRERGYAINDEEMQIGCRCLSAPIRDVSGAVIAAVNLSGTVFNFTDESMEKMIPKLLDTVRDISRTLGYNLK